MLRATTFSVDTPFIDNLREVRDSFRDVLERDGVYVGTTDGRILRRQLETQPVGRQTIRDYSGFGCLPAGGIRTVISVCVFDDIGR